MKKSEYLALAVKHAPKLRSLLGNYHPASAKHARDFSASKMRITAAAAEGACAVIREQIAEQEAEKAHPIARFDAALQSGNADEIDELLQSAWFGVPESTECWNIRGFREAVQLLEDPAEDEQ